MQRRIVHFSGRVQGVGFRYTAAMLAKQFPVAGFVQNLEDGRVKLVVEGAADEIDRFVEAIQQRMAGLVRNTTSEISAATEEFQDFGVRH